MLTPSSLQIDLLRLLHLIRQRHPKLLKSGFPGRRDFLLLNKLLFSSQDIEDAKLLDEHSYLLFLYEIAYQLDLFQEIEGRLYVHPTNAHAFFHSSLGEQQEQIFQAYLRLVLWSEMRFATGLQVQLQDAAPHPFPAQIQLQARRLLLEKLIAWLSLPLELDDIFHLVKEEEPDLLQLSARFAAQPYASIAVQLPDEKSRQAEHPEDWGVVEGAFVQQMLSQALTWLGLIAPRKSKEAPFRLQESMLPPSIHPVSSAPPPSNGPTLLVQPNLEILVFPSPSLMRVLYQLEHFCTPTGGEQILQYRLEKKGFFQALRNGYAYTQIIRLLEEESRMPLPQNLRQQLDSWYQQSSQIVISRQGVVVEASSPKEMAALLEEEFLEIPHYILDAQHIFVPAHAIPLLKRVEAHNQAQHLHYDQAPIRSLQVDKELFVRLLPQQADLFAETFLQKYAVALPEDRRGPRYQITQASLASAQKQGHSFDALLHFLEERAQIFPSTARLRLEALTQNIGPVFAGHLPILLVQDERTMDRLLYEGGLGAYTQRIGPKAALLDPAHLDKINGILQSMGVSFDEEEHHSWPKTLQKLLEPSKATNQE